MSDPRDQTEVVRPTAAPQSVAIVVALIAAIGPAILWPGDTPWVYDEPAEIRLALQANQHHRLADHALSGNFWVWYGPLPIQIMQAFLAISHDPRWLVVMRGSLYALITCGSLLWLGRTLRLNLWFVVAIVLAPHLWLWNRQLWAAYLAVPVSALCVAAYASFLRNGRGAALATAIGAAMALPLIHPQGLPLTIVVAAHVLWTQRTALLKRFLPVLAVVVLILLLNAQYLRLTGTALYSRLQTSTHTEHPTRTSRAAATLGALMGGRLISADGFNETPVNLHRSQLLDISRIMGMACIPLVWLGIAVALWRVTRPWTQPPLEPVIMTMLGIVVAAIAVQSVYFGALRVPPAPYYLFGMFGINALAAWIGVEALARLRLRGAVIAICIFSLACFSLGTQWIVHRDGWPANQISPTLNEQIALVQTLNEYSDDEAWTNVSTYRDHEVVNALWGLRLLYAQDREKSRESGRLFIRYKLGADGRPTGRIELIELEPGVNAPPDAQRILLDYPDD